jgi:hypothetical protein
VTSACVVPLEVRRTICGAETGARRPPACSGQRIPTAAGVMHSVQIGRPHSEHESPVWRSGCR